MKRTSWSHVWSSVQYRSLEYHEMSEIRNPEAFRGPYRLLRMRRIYTFIDRALTTQLEVNLEVSPTHHYHLSFSQHGVYNSPHHFPQHVHRWTSRSNQFSGPLSHHLSTSDWLAKPIPHLSRTSGCSGIYRSAHLLSTSASFSRIRNSWTSSNGIHPHLLLGSVWSLHLETSRQTSTQSCLTPQTDTLSRLRGQCSLNSSSFIWHIAQAWRATTAIRFLDSAAEKLLWTGLSTGSWKPGSCSSRNSTRTTQSSIFHPDVLQWAHFYYTIIQRQEN